MMSSRAVVRAPVASHRAASHLARSIHACKAAPRPAFVVVQHIQLSNGSRHFSSSPQSPRIKEFFEQKQTGKVRKTPSAWPHPGAYSPGIPSPLPLTPPHGPSWPSCPSCHPTLTPPAYTEEQMRQVTVAHRVAKTRSDKVALTAVKILRWGMDVATGYKHHKAVALNAKDPEAAQKKYAMTEEKYMIRNIFLESVAGVPGMVAGMLRHLHSMRRMKRDNGW